MGKDLVEQPPSLHSRPLRINKIGENAPSLIYDIEREYLTRSNLPSSCTSDGSIDISTFFQLSALTFPNDFEQERPDSRPVDSTKWSTVLDDQKRCSSYYSSCYPVTDVHQYQQLNFLLFNKPIEIQTDRRLEEKEDGGKKKIQNCAVPMEIEMAVDDSILMGILLDNLCGSSSDPTELEEYDNSLKRQVAAINAFGKTSERKFSTKLSSVIAGRLARNVANKLLKRRRSLELKDAEDKKLTFRR